MRCFAQVVSICPVNYFSRHFFLQWDHCEKSPRGFSQWSDAVNPLQNCSWNAKETIVKPLQDLTGPQFLLQELVLEVVGMNSPHVPVFLWLPTSKRGQVFGIHGVGWL